MGDDLHLDSDAGSSEQKWMHTGGNAILLYLRRNAPMLEKLRSSWH